MPKNEKILEDSSVQPLSHLAASTVRTFELVYSGGKTDILLSAETVEDMRKYTGLVSLVYGGLKFERAEPQPAFMRELPVVTGLLSADLRKGAARSQHRNSGQSNRPHPLSRPSSQQIAVQRLRKVNLGVGAGDARAAHG